MLINGTRIEKEKMLKWFDKRITQLALGLPENEWKYSDKQMAQKIRRLIEKIICPTFDRRGE